MSRGLRALVATTRPTTPRLRPRPVSRFEAAGMSVPDSEFELVAEPERPVNMRPVPVDVHTEDATASTSRTRRPGAAPAEVVAAATVLNGPAAATESAVALRARTTVSPPVSAALRPIAPPPTPRSAPAAPHHHAPPPPELPVPDQPNDPGIQHRSIPAPVPVRPHPAQRPAHTADPRLGALVPPPIPSVLAPPNGRTEQSPGPAAATHALAPVHRSQPDVHVSIGRIEVHATSAAVTAPTRADAAARSGVIGLDDYLTQRGQR